MAAVRSVPCDTGANEFRPECNLGNGADVRLRRNGGTVLDEHGRSLHAGNFCIGLIGWHLNIPNLSVPWLPIMNTKTLARDLLHRMDAYWRAANYLSVGQIYCTTIRC